MRSFPGHLPAETSLADWRWLTGDAAAHWLARATQPDQSLVALAAALRSVLPAPRVHLVLTQVDLRRRAGAKFESASQMLFTRVGLEQATDQYLAAHKAKRFSGRGVIADLCCGIGGDLLGLARQCPVVGVDRDPVAALLAQHNARVCGLASANVCVADATAIPLETLDAWHIDPDRRPAGRRTTRVDRHEPGPAVIDKLLGRSPHGAVKLSPATDVPPRWAERAELEWLGHRRQCQQLVAWFGALAEKPGLRRATVLGSRGARSVVSSRTVQASFAANWGRYVFEPHAAVLAAGLVDSLADQVGLARVGHDTVYLTGDRCLADPALECFEVCDVLPLDIKRLRSLVRQRRIGRLEVKTRGVPHDPATVLRQLRPRGPQLATLLLTRLHGQTLALLARREKCDSESTGTGVT